MPKFITMTRLGVNMELSAKDTRRINNSRKINVIYRSAKSAILMNEDSSKEIVYVIFKLV